MTPASCNNYGNIYVSVYPGNHPNPTLKCQQQNTDNHALCEVPPSLCLNWIQQATDQGTACNHLHGDHHFGTTEVPNLDACKTAAAALGGNVLE